MLLASVYLRASPDQSFSSGAETAFYSSIETSNKTKKATEPGRLSSVDAVFFETLDRLGLRPETVMDVGVSSGQTTVDWLEGFKARGRKINMLATDYVMDVYIYSLGWGITATAEPNGHLLQIELLGIPIRTYKRRRDYLIGAWLWRRLLCTFVRSKLATAGRQGPFKLVSPKLKGEPGVQLLNDDILAVTPTHLVGRADVVRVANLMQAVYFTDDQMKRAARNIRDRCRGAGSLVIICRDFGGQIDCSIMRLTTKNTFVVEARMGSGSEAEPYFAGA